MMAAERGAAPRTIAAYRADLDDFAAFLGGASVEGADAEALRRYLARLDDAGMAPRTAARRLSALRQFHQFLFAEGIRADDPTSALDSPRLGRPLPKVLSEDEVKSLIDAAAGREELERLRLLCLLELLYGAGLRVSELVALPLAAATRDARFLVVRGKGGKERLVPLSPPARAARQRGPPHPAALLPASQGISGRRRDRSASLESARAAPRLRDPSPRRRRRSAQRPGDARPRRRGHDADLYPCSSRAAAESRRDQAPARAEEELRRGI
jgi:integrase